MDLLRQIRGRRAGEISRSIEQLVRAGELRGGEPLPTVRGLAVHLDVSPTTVAAAYRDLRARGLVAGAGRRGTRVSRRPPAVRGGPGLAAGGRNLAQGNPDPALLPDLRLAAARLPAERRLYGGPTNRADLLALAAGLIEADGVSAAGLAVVGGALDGIERVLHAHLRPGDRVVVEDPGYPALHDLLLALGLRPEPVPVDDYGYLPEALVAALRGPVRAVIATPRAQNPTGAALDRGRAAELGEALRARPGLLLIEDDHAGPVAGGPALCLCARPPEQWALVRSVSKSLGPDLRLAFLAGDAVTLARVENHQRIGAGWVSHVLQAMVAALLHDPETGRLMTRAAAAYSERRAALLAALAERGVIARGRSGLNVWVPVRDEADMVARLLGRGWVVAAGERFRFRTGPGIRISIGDLGPGEAVALAAAISDPGERWTATRSA